MMGALRNPSVMGKWGPEPDGTRIIAAHKTRHAPIEWDAAAERDGVRRRVFTASIADVFEQWDGPMLDSKGKRLAVSKLTGEWAWLGTNGDHRVGTERWGTMDDVRIRLFRTIMLTPNLDWLLVTKRPEHVNITLARLMNRAYGVPIKHSALGLWLENWLTGLNVPHNVWMITTAEDQANADARVPELLKIPAVVRGVSYEPALGPVDWSPWLHDLSWIIVGGESGARDKARPFDLAWARDTIRQCREAGTACFVKQMGSNPIEVEYCGLAPNSIPDVVMDHHLAMGGSEPDDVVHRINFEDSKGGNPEEWADEFRVQEFPTPKH